MRVTRRRAKSAYAFLRQFPPFCHWSLPEPDAVDFRISRSRSEFGSYDDPKGVHTICVSKHLVTSFNALQALMAHECVHLAQRIAGDENDAQHNRAWIRRARRVCRALGWDYSKGFK